MANTVSAAYKVVQPNRTQAFLRSKLIASAITKSEFGVVAPAQTIKFPYGNSVKVQDYGYMSGNTRTDQTLVNDSYTIDQVKTAVMGYDKIQNLAIANPSWVSDIEQEMAYQLQRQVDQSVIAEAVSGAYTTVAGGTVTAGGLLQLMAETNARLVEAQKMEGMMYWVMDPLRAALLPQMNATTGFVKSDDALAVGYNGYMGSEAVGFKVLVSNDLGYTVSLTHAATPTNGQTITIGGHTWTFATTAVNPGEIAISGASQTNLRDAVNGTGTPGSSAYIDLAAEERIEIQNSGLSMAAFSGNVAVITKYGRINGSTTNGTNAFGVETCSMLAGVAGAIDMTMLQAPMFEELMAQTSGATTHAKDMIMTTMWGAGVWHRRARSLAKVTFNA